MAELSEVGSCRNTRKLGQHKGAAHKLALLNGRPHEFISGGEDGLIMGLDVRNSEPDKLIVQVIYITISTFTSVLPCGIQAYFIGWV